MSDVSMQFPGERLPFLSDEKNLRDEKNLHDTAISRASYFLNFLALKIQNGASLVAQWLRICLLMQETRVRALVWEDPTCHGAAGPVSHSC